MPRVEVGRYNNPKSIGYFGWVCTDDWILFEKLDGLLQIYRRDPDTGAVRDSAVELRL